MAIRRFLFGERFDPDVIKAMSQALEDVCAALEVPTTAMGAREVLARRLMSLARRGERSAGRTRDVVLAEARQR